MTGDSATDTVFTCNACDYTAPVRPGAGWTLCPGCGSDDVTSPPAEAEPAAAAEPVQAETTRQEG